MLEHRNNLKIMAVNDEKIKNLRKQLYIIEAANRDLQEHNSQLMHQVYHGDFKDESKSFKNKCPTENCVAFLNRDYKCMKCDINFCKKCFKPVLENHECIEDDILTYQEIKNNTKPCPSCSERISKVDGCDQMWCVMCKTAFSWKSGNIINGAIHNPEYFRWLRENPQGIEEDYRTPERQNNCVFPNNRFYVNLITTIPEFARDQDRLINLYTLGVELNDKIETLNLHNESEDRVLFTNRIHYLNGNVNTEQFNKTIINANKNKDKNNAFINIFNTVKTVILEFTWAIIDINQRQLTADNLIEALRIEFDRVIKIRIFANEAFHKLSSSKMYKCKKYFINNHYYLR